MITRGVIARAAAAGLGAGLVLTATMLALRLNINAPSFPERIDDALLLIMPQALFSELLERLRFAAKPLLFVGIVLALLVIGTLGGLIYCLAAIVVAGRADLTNPLFGGVVGIFASVVLDFLALPALGATAPVAAIGWSRAAPALLLTILPGLTYGVALTILLRLLSPARPSRAATGVGYAVPRGRVTRRALVALLIPLAGALVTGGALRKLLGGASPQRTVAALPNNAAPTATAQATASPTGTANATATTTVPPTATATVTTPTPTIVQPSSGPSLGSPVAIATPPTATQPSIILPTATPVPTSLPPSTPTPLPTVPPLPTPTPTPTMPTIPAGVAPPITPNGQFYMISKNFLDPIILGERWECALTGLIERPRTLRLADLRALPSVSQPTTLTCISNEVGGDLIGTAIWTGVPLADLLASAGLRPATTDLIFTCDDGYTETLPINRALDPATLLVYAMNGSPLTERHGYPARLIVPGRYGMKNPKWIVGIAVTTQPPVGYWTQRGWAPDEPIQTGVRIDVPGNGATLAPGPTPVGDIAFAGDRGVSRVEISVDGGTTWRLADLEASLGPATWTRWVAQWTPIQTGSHTIIARAYDGDGRVQTATARKAGPGGATGYARHEVVVAA